MLKISSREDKKYGDITLPAWGRLGCEIGGLEEAGQRIKVYLRYNVFKEKGR
jgi:hypothetical protein